MSAPHRCAFESTFIHHPCSSALRTVCMHKCVSKEQTTHSHIPTSLRSHQGVVSVSEQCEDARLHPRNRYRITGISLSVLKQIDPSEQKTLANLPWIVEPGQEAKRGINTKYETTIFWYPPSSRPRGALHAKQSRSRLSFSPPFPPSPGGRLLSLCGLVMGERPLAIPGDVLSAPVTESAAMTFQP